MTRPITPVSESNKCEVGSESVKEDPRGPMREGGNLARNLSGRRARAASVVIPPPAISRRRQNNNLVLFLRRRARQAAFKRHIRVGIKVNVMLLPGSNKKKKHIRHDYTCKTNGRCHFKT